MINKNMKGLQTGLLLHCLQYPVYGSRHLHDVCRVTAVDTDRQSLLPVHTPVVGFRRIHIPNLRHVSQAQPACIEGQASQLCRRPQFSHAAQQITHAPIFHGAAAQIDMIAPQPCGQSFSGQAMHGQALWRHVDLNLLLLQAMDIDFGHPLNGLQAPLKPIDHVVQL